MHYIVKLNEEEYQHLEKHVEERTRQVKETIKELDRTGVIQVYSPPKDCLHNKTVVLKGITAALERAEQEF